MHDDNLVDCVSVQGDPSKRFLSGKRLGGARVLGVEDRDEQVGAIPLPVRFRRKEGAGVGAANKVSTKLASAALTLRVGRVQGGAARTHPQCLDGFVLQGPPRPGDDFVPKPRPGLSPAGGAPVGVLQVVRPGVPPGIAIRSLLRSEVAVAVVRVVPPTPRARLANMTAAANIVWNLRHGEDWGACTARGKGAQADQPL